MVCIIGLVYGPHVVSDRRRVWEELKVMKEDHGIPFLVMGDFNEILRVGERNGNPSVTKGMKEFEDWVNALNFMDLPIIGGGNTHGGEVSLIID